MSALLAELAAASVQEVEAGGLHWRLRRVASVDLLEAGGGYLLAARRTARLSAEAEVLATAAEAEAAEALRAAAEGPVETRAALQAAAAAAAQRAQAARGQASPADGQVAGGLRFLDAVCAAGVTHVSRDGKVWDALRFVTDRKAEDVATGRLHLSSAPPGVPGKLAMDILALSGAKEAGELLARFLRAATTAPGRARPPVRDRPADGGAVVPAPLGAGDGVHGGGAGYG